MISFEIKKNQKSIWKSLEISGRANTVTKLLRWGWCGSRAGAVGSAACLVDGGPTTVGSVPTGNSGPSGIRLCLDNFLLSNLVVSVYESVSLSICYVSYINMYLHHSCLYNLHNFRVEDKDKGLSIILW